MATGLTSVPRSGGNGAAWNGGGDGGGRPGPRPLPADTWRLGMMFGLASVSMLFIGLTSAYVVRQGLGGDWLPLRMPRAARLNTAVLIASSVTVEKARRRAPRPWLAATIALGLAFLGGQLAAWRELASQGIYLGTNPHSSFFYLLTALHAAHLAGGIVALGYAAIRVRRPWLDAAALYWHFMDGLWIYLLVLLFGRG